MRQGACHLQVGSYFAILRRTIAACVYVSSWQYEEDARTPTEGFFKARVIFVDNSFLEFREYVNTTVRPVHRYSYSFHYQKQNQLIFRYDNTPHHPQLSSFPHHKHVGLNVIESTPPYLRDVLKEIETYLTKP